LTTEPYAAQQYKGNSLLRFHGNTGYAKALQYCVRLRCLSLKLLASRILYYCCCFWQFTGNFLSCKIASCFQR